MLSYIKLKAKSFLKLNKEILKNLALFFAICSGYYIVLVTTNFRLICPLHALTGLDCGFCGLTRMCLALMRLDFEAAFWYNPVVYVLSQIDSVLLLIYMCKRPKWLSKNSKVYKTIFYSQVVVLCIFTVVRNCVEILYV